MYVYIRDYLKGGKQLITPYYMYSHFPVNALKCLRVNMAGCFPNFSACCK